MSKIDLRLGDCLEVMKSIPNNSIDAIITDPPYGTTACKWDSVIDFELMWEQLNRIIKPNGAIVLFGSEPFSSALRMSNIKNYKYDWIWEKNNSTGFQLASVMPLKKHEVISIFSDGNTYPLSKNIARYIPQNLIEVNKVNKRGSKSKYLTESGCKENSYIQKKTNYPTSILKIDKVNKTVHPTQKPIALMEYLIKTYTNENETVLDFTMGSGSTGVASKILNRNFIGIEQDANYFNIATDRICKDKQKELF